MKKFNRKKILKKLKIKQIKTKYSDEELFNIYGFVPGGFAMPKYNEIWIHPDVHAERTFIHEVFHIIFKHVKNYNRYYKHSILQEIEVEILTRRVCKIFGFGFTDDYLRFNRRNAKKMGFTIKPRYRNMEKAFEKFMKAVES